MVNQRLIITAANYAADIHRNQVSFSTGLPYINHLLSMGYWLSKAGIEQSSVIAAAYLINVVNDGNTTADSLRKIFGDLVANIVDELTFNPGLTQRQRAKYRVRNAEKYSDQAIVKGLSLRVSDEARLIIAADILDHLRNLWNTLPDGWTVRRRLQYAVWCYHVTQHSHTVLDDSLRMMYTRIIGTEHLSDSEYLRRQLRRYYKSL